MLADIAESKDNCSQNIPRLTLRSLFVLFVFVLLFVNMGGLCFYWDDYHRNNALYHLSQYHERNHESIIRSEEDRRYRHEEYAEYQAKFLESAREHEHEHQEALKRDDEQIHENDETERENERDSRQIISPDPKNAIIDQNKAKSFLKRWPKT